MSYCCFLLFILLQRLFIMCDGGIPIGVFVFYPIAKEFIETIELVNKVWVFMDAQHDDLVQLENNKFENALFEKMDEIHMQLDEINTNYQKGSQTIIAITENLPGQLRHELRLNDLFNYYYFINIAYNQMKRYTAEREKFEKETLEDFADHVVSHQANSVTSMTQKIYFYVVPDEESPNFLKFGILDSLIENLQKNLNNKLACKETPRQTLFNLFNAIGLAQLHGYTMTQFSYMIKKTYGHGNFVGERSEATEVFQARINKMKNVLKNTMYNVSNEYWRCDPKEHVLGETYEQINRLVQGYESNVECLDPNGNCNEGCSYYEYVDTRNKNFPDISRCAYPRCQKIVDCIPVHEMYVCKSNNPSRRYDYVELPDGTTFGRKRTCNTVHYNSWNQWIVQKCAYCFCLCYDDGVAYNSNRYVSLKMSVSNVGANMVVTGMRFKQHNNIMHLQVQEGKLLPMGKVNQSTIRWVPLDNFHIGDEKVFKGETYSALSWEERAFDLDDLKAPPDHLVVGVRFQRLGKRINFEMLTLPFNLEKGTLDYRGVVYDNYNNNTERIEVKLNNPDIPTESYNPSIPTSKSNQYIKLTNSDIYKDAAQTTVPFFDIQPVESATPLNGAGIFHKGADGFGGFLALKIMIYDGSIDIETDNAH